MRRIRFSDVGVIVNSIEDVDEIYLMYTTLGIAFENDFEDSYRDAKKKNLEGFFIQCTLGNVDTKLRTDNVRVSIIDYPITYSMESLDFAIACQLLMTNQESELKAHLAQHCKEYK